LQTHNPILAIENVINFMHYLSQKNSKINPNILTVNKNSKEYKRHNKVPRMEKIRRKGQNRTKTREKIEQKHKQLQNNSRKKGLCCTRTKRWEF
jgi:hypothetical protein